MSFKPKMMKVPLKMKRRDLLIKLLEILNYLNPKADLTLAEITMLVEFILLPSHKFKYQRFSTLAKKRVQESLIKHYNWKVSRENLNNKIYSLIEKNVIWRDEDGVLYLSSIFLASAEKALENFENKHEFNIVISLNEEIPTANIRSDSPVDELSSTDSQEDS